MNFKSIQRKMNLQSLFPALLIFLCFQIASAATLTVTNTNDSGAGSLRQTIADASSGDTIDFNLPNCPCTIQPTSTGYEISKSLNITGPGAEQLSINGGFIADINRRRIFHIFSGTVNIDGMTITGARGTSGGGISNAGTLNLTNSVISDNGNAFGGILNSGTLIVAGSAIVGNFGTALGGVYNAGTAHIINSTISGNATLYGGGIYNSGTLTVTNGTITNNRAGSNLTIEGSGIRIASGTATLNNTIVANNFNTLLGTQDDIVGTITNAHHNLIGNAAYSGGIMNGVDGNIVGNNGVGVIDINTVLDTTLMDNGGQTPTHALVANSPATGAGSNALALDAIGNPLTTDQRGTGFPRIVGGTVDIGAFEFLLDSDGDNVPDDFDNCPLVSNPDQTDTDADGAGNTCDADDDNDGVADTADNCPLTSNPDQADFDLDGIGDTCDAQTGPPSAKEQCKEGAWQRFNYPRSFANQGDCLRFLLRGY
jgi:hypothetical protein